MKNTGSKRGRVMGRRHGRWDEFEIYVIESADYWYVGFTFRGVGKRVRDHLSALRTHRGDSKLYRKMQELGTDAFTVRTLVTGYWGWGDPIDCLDSWYWIFRETDPRTTLNVRPPRGWKGHQDQRSELPPRSEDLPPTCQRCESNLVRRPLTAAASET